MAADQTSEATACMAKHASISCAACDFPGALRSLRSERISIRWTRKSAFQSAIDTHVVQLDDVPLLRARSSAILKHVCSIASLVDKLAPFKDWRCKGDDTIMIITEHGRDSTSRISPQQYYVSAQSTSWSSKSACIWSHGICCRDISRLLLHGYSPRCKYPSLAVLTRHVHALFMSCPSDSLSSCLSTCTCRFCSCGQIQHFKHPSTA